MSNDASNFAEILKGWGPTLTRAIRKANSSRWPGGAPGGKGGQFAPGKGGTAPYSGSLLGFKAPQLGLGSAKHLSQVEQPKPLMAGKTQWHGPGDTPPEPKLAPPGAKPHLKTDDFGKPVTINYPSKPSHPATWDNATVSATFTPGSETPSKLNGVAMKPWADRPKNINEWANVEGQKPELDADFPLTPTPGKSVGAGVIVVEADGRVWLTKPTNHFGGYKQTFPKGTVENGISLQASAIKETWEETGLKVRITGVLGDYERTTSVARFYVAQRVGGTPADMGWESQAVRLAAPADLKSFLNSQTDKDIVDDWRREHLMKAAPLSLLRDAARVREYEERRGLEWLLKAGVKPGGGAWQHQERWPGGTPLGGQWKAMGADGLTLPPKIAGGLEGKNAAYQKQANAIHAAAQAGNLKSVIDTAINLDKKVKANSDAGKTSSHVKWTAQVSQFATQLVGDMTAKPKAEAAATKLGGTEKLSAFTKVGEKPGGSNDGAVYADASGQKWLVKGNNYAAAGGVAMSDDRAHNEVLASKLMAAAGIPAPEMKIVDLEGKHTGNLGVAVKWVDGLSKFNTNDAAQLSAVQSQFAVHAWLGNWDVLGATIDNVAFKDGKAINIDPGGSILFRAQGAPKKAGLFDAAASDFESMRSTDASQKKVFGSMTASQLQESAKQLANVSDDTINKLVDAHGPGDAKAKADLATTLKARRDAIIAKAGLNATPEALSPKVEVKVAEPTPPPEPPKLSEAVKAPADTPIPAAATAIKPTFNSGLNSDAYYGKLVDKAEELHKAGDLTGMMAMIDPKKAGTWGNKTINSKKLMAYHGALYADLVAKQGKAVDAVVAGTATVTDAKGATWKASDGVLNPVAAAPAQSAMSVLARAHGGIMNGGPSSTAVLEELAPSSPFGQLYAAVKAGNMDAAKNSHIMSHGEASDDFKAVQAKVVAAMEGKAPAAPQGFKLHTQVKIDMPTGANALKPIGLKGDAGIMVAMISQYHQAGNLAALKNYKAASFTPGPDGKTIASHTKGHTKVGAYLDAAIKEVEAKQPKPAAPKVDAAALNREEVKDIYNLVSPGGHTGGAIGGELKSVPTDGEYGTIQALAFSGNWKALESFQPSSLVGSQFKSVILTEMKGKAAKAEKAPAANPAKGKALAIGDAKQAFINSGGTGTGFYAAIKTPGFVTEKIVTAAMRGDLAGVQAVNVETGSATVKAFKDAVIIQMGGTTAEFLESNAPPPFANTTPAPVVQAQEPGNPDVVKPTTAAPAMPDFGSWKLAIGVNAASHNSKVDTIEALASKGDVKGLLALNFSVNTYGKKQATLVNDALASLGSTHKVSPGQAKNSHPALVGGAVQNPQPPKAAEPPNPSLIQGLSASGKKRTLAELTAEKLPSPPDMMNWNGNGNAYSSKAWKNEANAAALSAMQQAALTGGMAAVDALKFPELDATTGQPTGNMVTASNHPAKKVIGAYAVDLSHAINDFLNPPEKLAAFNTISSASVKDAAASFLGTKIGTTVDKQPKNQQFGFWIALGKVADKNMIEPTVKADLTDAQFNAGGKKYAGYSGLTKEWISGVQSSGAINRAIDEGKKTYGGNDLKEVTKAIYKDATPMPAGSTIYRWQNMPNGMLKQMESAEPGLVFQSLGGFCTSQSPTATQHFGKHRLTIRMADGAKAIHSHGSGKFGGEMEITTIPGQRFVLLNKQFSKSSGKWELELLMLPPDEGFVA